MRGAMVLALAVVVLTGRTALAQADGADVQRFGRLAVRARIEAVDPDADGIYTWVMTAKFRNRSASRGWAGTCRIAWSVDYALSAYPDASGAERFRFRLKPDAPTLVRQRALADVAVFASDTVVTVDIRRCREW